MEGSAGLELRWADGGEERAEAARFLARVIAVDADYISHGEIAHGLSADGVTWAPDLESRLVRELRDDGRACGVALARFEGALAGVASVTWEAAGPAPHAILADLAVDPTRRGGGIGAALVAFVEAEARRRGLGWVMLESGLRNARAHDFFERAGFDAISKVFAKRL